MKEAVLSKDPFLTLISKIKAKRKRLISYKSLVLAVNGLPKCGSTTFSKKLCKTLEKDGMKTVLVQVNDFQLPYQMRYSPNLSEPKNYYKNNFNFLMIFEKLVKPSKTEKDYSIDLPIFNTFAESYDTRKKFYFPKNTVLIIEGPFLLQKSFLKNFDYSVFLKISEEESIKRFNATETAIFGKEVYQNFEKIYKPAQEIYFKEQNPEQNAKMVIENETLQNFS
ncbi:MAG: hypothetical protein DWQ06_09295 [Calditrichaeota bacterium]|nr:MAG: hypothetical protein DWQ06_09295 [Calditrichota bacterium]